MIRFSNPQKFAKLGTKRLPYFGSTGIKEAVLLLRIRISNIFVSFLDKRNRLLSSTSSGSAGIDNSKRKKIAPQAMLPISYKVSNSFIFNHVFAYSLYFFTFSVYHVYFFVRGLSRRGITPKKFFYCMSVAHNGTRPKRIRRL